jgi:peptidoglycan/LPS O-acetylase OafA/YrhL
VTTAYLAIALLPGLQKSLPVDYIASSYAFFPYPAPDGSTLQPIVGQGWSLNYEMPFYAIFALALFAPARVAVLGASGILTGVVALGQVFEPVNPMLRFWTDPIILEFVFGMLLGLAYLRGVRLPRAAGWALVAGGLALFLASRQTHDLLGGRVIPWGIPAVAAVAGATLGGVTASGAFWRGLVVVGEASYALYLTHAVVVRGLVAGFRHLGIDLPFWPGLALALALSTALAIAVHYAFELPVKNALRGLVPGAHAERKSVAAMVA